MELTSSLSSPTTSLLCLETSMKSPSKMADTMLIIQKRNLTITTSGTPTCPNISSPFPRPSDVHYHITLTNYVYSITNRHNFSDTLEPRVILQRFYCVLVSRPSLTIFLPSRRHPNLSGYLINSFNKLHPQSH